MKVSAASCYGHACRKSHDLPTVIITSSFHRERAAKSATVTAIIMLLGLGTTVASTIVTTDVTETDHHHTVTFALGMTPSNRGRSGMSDGINAAP